MKKTLLLIATLIALAASRAAAFDGPYFQGIWENGNYAHPLASAGELMTTKGAYDGVATKIALVWHPADPLNSIIPLSFQRAGIKPFSWTLLDCGAGYGNGTGKLDCGAGVNFAPTLLGPLAQPLEASSSPAAQLAGQIISADLPNGSGLNIGPTWAATPIQNGTIMPLNHWGSHLDFFFGASYAF